MTPRLEATEKSVAIPKRGRKLRFSSASAVTGAIGVGAIVLGNIATILTHVETIRSQLLHWVDVGSFLQIHGFITVASTIAVTLGYIAVAYWIYVSFIRDLTPKIRYFAMALGVMGVPVVAFLSVVAVAPATSKSIIDEQVSHLAQSILAQQQTQGPNSGGFRFTSGGTSQDTQPWTSAQCLVALLSTDDALTKYGDAIRNGLNYLKRVKASDKGWGYQEGDAIAVTEVNAWVLLADIMSLKPRGGKDLWAGAALGEMRDGIWRDLAQLAARQHQDGGWGPLSRTSSADHLRTYSTVMALWALVEARDNQVLRSDPQWHYDDNIQQGAKWLLGHYIDTQGPSYGWFPHPGIAHPTRQFPGLTAQVLYVLERAGRQFPYLASMPIFAKARARFLSADSFTYFSDLPLTENQRSHDTDRYLPLDITKELPEAAGFKVEASTFLWFPWVLASAVEFTSDELASASERSAAERLTQLLIRRTNDKRRGSLRSFVSSDEAIYPTTEALYGLQRYLQHATQHREDAGAR